MKRIVMQLLRLIVTVIVMGTMAVMIFTLRGENAALKRQLAVVQMSGEPGVFETIRARTSIRKFDPSVPVSEETVEKILRAGMCAPSALNKQPWEFVVVREPELLKAIGEAMPFSRVGNGAQAAIVVCGNLDNGIPGRGKEFWIHDCSAASMNILLAAKALGLGAVWTGVFPDVERAEVVRKLLAIPEGYMPLNIIPLGAPAENPEPKNKWNPAKVHSNRW